LAMAFADWPCAMPGWRWWGRVALGAQRPDCIFVQYQAAAKAQVPRLAGLGALGPQLVAAFAQAGKEPRAPYGSDKLAIDVKEYRLVGAGALVLHNQIEASHLCYGGRTGRQSQQGHQTE